MRRSNLFCTGFFTIMILALTTSTSAFVSSDGDAVPEGLTRTAWQQMRAVIERDRYRLNRDEGSDVYRAPNPAQGLNTVFTRNGFVVSTGNGSNKGPSKESAWNWGLHLTAYGYGSDLRPVAGAAKLVSNGNRIEYQRGNLTEWYIIDHRGLEQGFTLNTRPEGWTASTPLALHMKAMGDLIPEVEKDGKGIIWRDTRGEEVLRYSGLYAFDAAGTALSAHMTAERQGVRIVVADHEAIYPITIDPWVQTARLTANDGAAGDNFGNSVAISGNTVVVGAYGDTVTASQQGSVYVFEKPVGGWTNTGKYAAKLTASDGAFHDRFGSSIDINGDIVVVGALHTDIGTTSDQGAVYIFEKPGGGWTDMNESAKLTAGDGSLYDSLGLSVAINGDTVVAGSRDYSAAHGNQGSAYVFEKPGTGWTTTSVHTAKLTASDGGNNDFFGVSVAINGDTVVVGAYLDDIFNIVFGNIVDTGSAYIFEKPGGGWADMNESAKLWAGGGAAHDRFGNSVAISGDTVVVGSYYDTVGGDINQGSTYIFTKPGPSWVTTSTYTAKLTASDGAANDYFGYSVAISGDMLVVGTYGDNNSQGSAYVYKKPGGGWATTSIYTTKLTANDGAAGDIFGTSVAISGDTLVVGANGNKIGANNSQGSAYIFVPGEGIFFPVKSRNGKTTVIYLE